MREPNERKPLKDLSRSLTTLDANHSLIAVIEMGQKSWLVAGIVPGVERQPLKKLDTDEKALLKLLDRWRMEAEKAWAQHHTDHGGVRGEGRLFSTRIRLGTSWVIWAESAVLG